MVVFCEAWVRTYVKCSQVCSPFAFPELALCTHFINGYCNQNPNATVVHAVSLVQSIVDLVIQLHWTGMSLFRFRLEGGAMPSSIHHLASSVKYKQAKNILLTPLSPSLSNIALIEASAKIEAVHRDHHAFALFGTLNNHNNECDKNFTDFHI